MHMMYKAGTVCLRVVDPHFIFDGIGVRIIRTHMCRLLPTYISLDLKQVLSFCTNPFLTPILSGGHM